MNPLKISEILDRRHVIPGLQAHDKEGLLEKTLRRAAVALKVDEREVRNSLLDRERLGSTGVGHGIAIPHARVAKLAQMFGMFARVEPALEYEAIDGAPVDLVFLLLTPAQSAGAMSALAAVSRRLREPHVVAAIRAASNAREIYDALAGP